MSASLPCGTIEVKPFSKRVFLLLSHKNDLQFYGLIYGSVYVCFVDICTNRILNVQKLQYRQTVVMVLR